MRKTAITLSLFLTSCQTLCPPTSPQYDSYGKEIIFVEDIDNKNKTAEHGAVAKYVNNNPYVYYNANWMRSMPEEMQAFFFQHEVAHFKLKQVKKKPYFASLKKQLTMEEQADCYSLRYLHDKLHYTSRQISTIYEFASLYLEEERAENLETCLMNK